MPGVEPTGAAEAVPGLSIVVPFYNEEQNVAPLYEKLHAALEQVGRSYELVFVNDGSQDRTGELLDALAERDPHVVAVTFRRNFGQTAALAAGIHFSRGRIIVPLDGDLQNDPLDIPRLLDLLDQGYDVVSGWRKQRRDGFRRVLISRVANWLISRFSGVNLHDYGCTLKAYRREVLEGVNLYGEMHRFIPIYATWQGARVTELPVTHHPRAGGRSHYGMERTLKVILDLIVVKFLASYLTKPIYVFGGFGLASMCLSAIAFVAMLVFKLLPSGNIWHKDFVATPLPVLGVGLLVLGVQMILIGLLAELQTRTYFESQNKPVYQVKHVRRRG